MQNQKEVFFSKKVTAALKKIGLFKKWKVIENVQFNDGKNDVIISQVVIGSFGVIAVQSRDFPGQVYASPNDKKWVNINDKDKTHFDNLIQLAQDNANSIRKIFSQKNIYRVEIFTLAVLSGHKLELYAPSGLSIVDLKKLKKEMKDKKYKEDKNIDVEKICEVFESLSKN